MKDSSVTTYDAPSHQISLDLLAEVCDFLGRLPPHPLTHEMHQKVQAHLTDPRAKALRDRLDAISAAEKKAALIQAGQAFHGWHRLSPSGAPFVECRLLYPDLRINSPAYQQALEAGEDAEAVLSEVAKQIAEGVTLALSVDRPLRQG